MDSFLFGNVDEDGKIENDFLDNDLKESLEKGDNEFLSMALSGGFNLQLNTQTLNSKSDQIKPNENAIDFYSFDETILDDVDETTDSNIQPMHSPNIINAIKIQKPNIIRLKSFITNKKPKEVPKLTNNQLIQQHFPDFKPGQTLKFTQLFAPKLLLKPKRFKGKFIIGHQIK